MPVMLELMSLARKWMEAQKKRDECYHAYVSGNMPWDSYMAVWREAMGKKVKFQAACKAQGVEWQRVLKLIGGEETTAYDHR